VIHVSETDHPVNRFVRRDMRDAIEKARRRKSYSVAAG
jgi:hypothetical protein